MSTSCSSLSGSLMGERLRGTFCMTVYSREKENHTLHHRTHTTYIIAYSNIVQNDMLFVVSDVHLMCFHRLFSMRLCVDTFCMRICVCSPVFLQVCERITLLADAAVCRFSWVLLIGSEVLLPLSLCLCLHSRQFLTATQHTERRQTVLLERLP